MHDQPIHIDLDHDRPLDIRLVATSGRGRFRHLYTLKPEQAEHQRQRVQEAVRNGRTLDPEHWLRIEPDDEPLPRPGDIRFDGRLLYTPNISFTKIPEPELRVVQVEEPVAVLWLRTPQGLYRSTRHWHESDHAERALEDHLPLSDFTVEMDPEAWRLIDPSDVGPLDLRIRILYVDAYRLEYRTPCYAHRHPETFESLEQAEAEWQRVRLELPEVLHHWEHHPIQQLSRPFAFIAIVDDLGHRHANLTVWDTHHIRNFTQLRKGDRVRVHLREHVYQGRTQWKVTYLQAVERVQEASLRPGGPGLDDRPRRIGRRVVRLP